MFLICSVRAGEAVRGRAKSLIGFDNSQNDDKCTIMMTFADDSTAINRESAWPFKGLRGNARGRSRARRNARAVVGRGKGNGGRGWD